MRMNAAARDRIGLPSGNPKSQSSNSKEAPSTNIQQAARDLAQAKLGV
jgi:hypothetical protein